MPLFWPPLDWTIGIDSSDRRENTQYDLFTECRTRGGGIEIRSDRPELRDWLAGLNHRLPQAVGAEREIIHQLSATCNQPVAVHFEPIAKAIIA